MTTTAGSIILPTTSTTPLNPIPTSIINDLPPIGSGSGNDNGGSRNVSYFFGFLIALIAFLVFFIGCGIGARRGLFRRRRRDEEIGSGLMPIMTFGRTASRMNPAKQPVLWETPFEKGSSQWQSMMPLSVSVVPDGVDDASGAPPYMPMLMPTANGLRPREAMLRNTILRWWMPRLPQSIRRPERETVPLHTISRTTLHQSLPLSSVPIPPIPMSDASGALPVKRTAADALTPRSIQPDFQVVVMIAMPSQHKVTDGSLGDLQFGITKLPVMWDSSVEFVS